MSKRINRRRFLQALGIGSSSFLFPSLLRNHGVLKAADGIPKRVIYFLTPLGPVQSFWHMHQGRSTKNDFQYDLSAASENEFSPILKPLFLHRNNINVVSGLSQTLTIWQESRPNKPDRNRHHISQAMIMTGNEPIFVGGHAQGHTESIDHKIGSIIGAPGQLKSVILGRAHQFPYCFDGSGSVATQLRSPAEAFGQLSGLATPSNPMMPAPNPSADDDRRKASVLDFVSGEFNRLRPRLGVEDRAKLDAHRDLVRDIERGLQSSGGNLATCDPTFQSAGDQIADFVKLAAMTVSCDISRVAVLNARQLSTGEVPDVDASRYGNIHTDVAHDSVETNGAIKNAENAQVMLNLYREYAKHFADLLSLLGSIPEAGGSVLDSTAVVWITEHSNGAHGLSNLPVIVGGGAMPTGRYLHYGPVAKTTRGQDVGPALEQLHVSVAHAVGASEIDRLSIGEVDGADGKISLVGPVPGLT